MTRHEAEACAVGTPKPLINIGLNKKLSLKLGLIPKQKPKLKWIHASCTITIATTKLKPAVG